MGVRFALPNKLDQAFAANGRPAVSFPAPGAPNLPVDAKGLANLMLDWGDGEGVAISPMKLQKLLYFCHADYLVQYQARLVRQDFEAWNYGPVIPSVYAEFKSAGDRAITTRASSFDPLTAQRCIVTCSLPHDEEARLRGLYTFYRQFTAKRLSDLSHELGGPWRQARSLFSNGLNMDRRVTTEMIQRHHRLIHD